MYVCWTGLPSTQLKVSMEFFVSFISINLYYSYSYSLTCARCIDIKQQYILHTNTNYLAIIPTYSRILNAIEKALQNLIKKY